MYKTIDTVAAPTLETGDTFEHNGAVFHAVTVDDQGDNIAVTALDEFEDETTLNIHPNVMLPLVQEVDDED
jgi:hypothetical protein